ncbi:DUF378 domain-containing protein [Desulfofalx alkaliphila]|uniref:DUF378 domain-containing protein n=1 Tax=Desulfofalx alkaliphila TaxID=105483 RepID=UPI0004E0D5E6|nr:DUF378 domain-containing protein [Desulfofalx alkaliphila]
MDTLRQIALALIIIGALNWLLVGLFTYDLVAAIFGGQTAIISRIIYTLVGVAGIYALTFFFRTDVAEKS